MVEDLPKKSWKRGWRAAVLAVVAVCGTLALALKIASARDGETMIAHALRTMVFPALDVKAGMRSPERFSESVREGRKAGDAPPPEDMRANYKVERNEIDGMTYYTVAPKSGPIENTVIYLHGGAYVGNMGKSQWSIVEQFLERTRSRLIVPFYPLAPEHQWQEAYMKLDSLYRHIAAVTPSSTIVLTGDSAGGGLALGLAMALRDAGLAGPGKIVLFSPWLNLVESNPAQEQLENRDPLLARPGLVWAAKRWAGSTPLDNPRISPVFGSLKGLAPIAVFSGTADLLHADSLQLVAKAKAEGVPIFYMKGRNMTHAWSVMPTADSESLYEAVERFVRNDEAR